MSVDKDGFISIKWHIDDVIYQAEENGIPITRSQAIEVLELVERTHNPNYGVSWETLDYFIDVVMSKDD